MAESLAREFHARTARRYPLPSLPDWTAEPPVLKQASLF